MTDQNEVPRLSSAETEWSIDCDGEEQTDVLGQRLAAVVSTGLVVTLDGELGSGKTRLIRSLCQGLGICSDHVNSPTFVILQMYTDGRLPVAHFDVYRLADVDEFLAIGAEEYLHSQDWLCLIEWASRVEDVLPSDRLRIQITQTGINSRRFNFIATGPTSASLIKRLGRVCR